MRTPEQAVAYATKYLTSGYNGLCLALVQDAYGAYARDASAIDAWNKSEHKHITSNLSQAPYGAPIYWSQSGNPYGHIAVHLDGDRMYTTDSGVGYPHEDSISKWQTSYGYKPLGWTDDIEGQLIPELTQDGDDMALTQDDINKVAQAVWSYIYDKKLGTTYNGLMYSPHPSAAEIAQEVWSFVASNGDNKQPNTNPYEQLKNSADVGGFVFTVDDEEHNNGKTVYWMNINTMKYKGFATWDEYTTWCSLIHMPTDKVVKLTPEQWESLQTFTARQYEN